MSGPGSVRRLLLEVGLLVALIVGLSRLAGRTETPGAGGGVSGGTAESLPATPLADEMSSAPPDLTFYRTLGKERSAPVGGGAAGGATINNDDVGGREPGARPGGEGAFLVQALSTRDAPAAKRLRDRLAARGFPATVMQDRVGRQPVYRVRVGRYRTRAEAEAAVRVLRQKLSLSPWILQEGE